MRNSKRRLLKLRLADSDKDLAKRPAHTIDTEEDLKDDELLGESTLAKLAPVPDLVEVPVEEVAVEETAPEETLHDDGSEKEEKE